MFWTTKEIGDDSKQKFPIVFRDPSCFSSHGNAQTGSLPQQTVSSGHCGVWKITVAEGRITMETFEQSVTPGGADDQFDHNELILERDL